MFANMFNRLLEPFIGSFNYTIEPNKSHEELRRYYGDKLANTVVVDKKSSNATTTYMGDATDTEANLSRRQSVLQEMGLLPANSLSKDIMSQRQTACEGTGGDSFKHLSNLAATVTDNKALFRCGWVYNNTDPYQGRGAYGTTNGPIETSAQGTWMWNLNEAKKKFHMSICSKITSCDDLTNPKFAGVCGFCTETNIGVAISGSTVAYPYEAKGACSSTSLVTSQARCPKPQPPPPPNTPAAIVYMESPKRKTCDVQPGNTWSRSCYIEKAKQAGCSDSGTLIAALKSGSDMNYLDTITQASSYILYQQRAATALNETYMKTGKLPASNIYGDFINVNDNATSAANDGLKAAAIDLCFTKGSFEEYDFCTELRDTDDAGKASLECIQNEFKRQGGQETGLLYPAASNVMMWKSMNSWKDIKIFIQDLSSKTKSSDRKTQQRAIDQFYGISLDRVLPSLGNIMNVEIFWFTDDSSRLNGDNTMFLGRRIRSQIPKLTGGSGLTGSVAYTGSFVYFTNLIAKSDMVIDLKFTGDAGFIFSNNKAMENSYASGSGLNKANIELSDYTPSYGDPETKVLSSAPWTFNKDSNNIITGYYVGTGKNYNIEYQQSPTVTPQGGPCFCYGHAGKESNGNPTRLYTKSECNDMNGNWSSNGECTKKGGSSYSYECRNLDDATCTDAPRPGWNNFLPNNLYLIQHPYAPMIKFAARPNYTVYKCNYPFCDKRLSSYKMKFAVFQGNGPTLVPVADAVGAQTPAYTLDKSYMKFATGSQIRSQFNLKMYSFMTMIFKVRFTTLPPAGMLSKPFIFLPSYTTLDSPCIYLTGVTASQARVGVGSSQNETTNSVSQNGIKMPGRLDDRRVIIKAQQDYFITLKALRTSEGDITTLTSLQVGTALVSDLQDDPNALKETEPLVWENKLHLENPDSSISRSLSIKADTCEFNLMSIEMYDYNVTGENLLHAANMDWPEGPQGSNPYK